MKTVAIITAAGKGKRMGHKIDKPYLTIADMPVLAHSVLPFERNSSIDAIIIVAAKGSEAICLRNVVKRFGLKKVYRIISGGRERQDSVMAGIVAAGKGYDMAVVHDGVRPFVTENVIKKTLSAAKKSGAAIAAVPVKDTIKEASSGFVKKTLQRERLWAVQTPQAFRFSILKKAHEYAKRCGIKGTDDSILVEKMGHKVCVVKGSYDNIKITTPEDLIIGEAILKNRGKQVKV